MRSRGGDVVLALCRRSCIDACGDGVPRIINILDEANSVLPAGKPMKHSWEVMRSEQYILAQSYLVRIYID